MNRYINIFTQKYLRTEKQKAYAEFFWTIGLLALLVWFAFKPNFSSVFGLNQKLVEAKAAEQSLNNKLESLGKAKDNLGGISANLSLLESALPEKQLILDFLNNVSALAGTDGVDLLELSYQEPRTTTYAGKPFDTQSAKAGSAAALSFPFTVRLKGDYLRLRKFLADLETAPRLINVDTFDFNKEVKENSLEVIISGRAFWFAP